MTKEEFIEILNERPYSYQEKRDKIVVTGEGTIILLSALESIPSGVEFNNRGGVYLYELKNLPPGVIFNNKENIILDSVKSISPDVKFNNLGNIRLSSLTGDWFDVWEGNIKGISYKRILNKMISLGLFDKEKR